MRYIITLNKETVQKPNNQSKRYWKAYTEQKLTGAGD